MWHGLSPLFSGQFTRASGQCPARAYLFRLDISSEWIEPSVENGKTDVVL
jgi:hypothetical protein